GPRPTTRTPPPKTASTRARWVDDRDPIDGVGQGGDLRRVGEQRGKVGAITHRRPFPLTRTSIGTTLSAAAKHGSQRPPRTRLASPHDGHARPLSGSRGPSERSPRSLLGTDT